jgi:indole-3-glycerol phosphate synthase
MMLDQILAATRERASTLSPTIRLADQREVRSLKTAIQSFSKANPIIGELKCSSPTRGKLRDCENAELLAEELVEGGCVALSVITEPTYFGGSTKLLTRVREHVPVPVLRKDFIVDTRQVHESHALGADAILLIARVLGKDLRAYVSLSRSLGLEPLVEVHTPAEVYRALASGADLLGINNRDLQTMKVDLGTTERLAPMCKNTTRIAMSGISSPADIGRLKGSVQAFLIGTALMTTPDLRATLEGFISA